MKHKKLLIILVILVLFSFAGCSSKHQEKNPDFVLVTFKDYDGSVLYHEKVAYGSHITANIETPTRKSEIDKVYKFSGWSESIEEPLYKNTIFIAQYNVEKRKYLVYFRNYDGSLLEEINVDYGSLAKYTKTIPTKNSTDKYVEYIFSGWDKDIDSLKIVEDTTFTAQFSICEYVYATFKNYDEEILKQYKIPKGTTPSYDGEIPTKPSLQSDMVYKFSGWDKSLTNISSDTSYIAKFELLAVHTVTFKNYDGTTLYVCKVTHGEDAKYSGTIPYKPLESSGDYEYTYIFSGWSGSLTNVTKDLVVVAKFKTQTIVSGQTAVKNHLANYGTGTYHQVQTGNNSNGTSVLGYDQTGFYIGYANISSSMESYMAIACTYESNYGTGKFQIYSNKVLMFSATYTIYFKNHEYSGISLKTLETCKYTTDTQIDLVAELSVLAAKFAVNNASTYLMNNGLPYIY